MAPEPLWSVAMSIVTKKGDRRTTRLLSGEEVSKADVRLEAYGTIDELAAQLGLARTFIKDAALAKEIRHLQVGLFRLAAEFAAIDPDQHDWVEATAEEHVIAIEARIRKIEGQIQLPKSFLIPGTCTASAALEVARTVARRLERNAVRLAEEGAYQNPQGLIYINRISDYLFLLARAVEVQSGIPFDANEG